MGEPTLCNSHCSAIPTPRHFGPETPNATRRSTPPDAQRHPTLDAPATLNAPATLTRRSTPPRRSRDAHATLLHTASLASSGVPRSPRMCAEAAHRAVANDAAPSDSRRLTPLRGGPPPFPSVREDVTSLAAGPVGPAVHRGRAGGSSPCRGGKVALTSGSGGPDEHATREPCDGRGACGWCRNAG
jgi:hypothetical protein